MNPGRTFLRYDLFKLIVALILLALLIALLFGLIRPPATFLGMGQPTADGQAQSALPTTGPPTATQPLAASTATSAPPEPTDTVAAPTPAPTEAAAAIATLAPTQPASATPTPSEATAAPTTAPTEQAGTAATATLTPTLPAAATPTPTGAAAAALTPTPATTQPGCPLAIDTRLRAGMTARVLRNLNLRSAPEIGDNLIRVNPAGTSLEITGEAVCGPFNGGAYLWWPVRMTDGTTGWSTEGSATAEVYYMQPE